MLQLQNFIKENSNWRELLAAAPYYLKIKEDDNYILFKYSQEESDFSSPIVCEARGVILRKSDLKVVRMAFKKFFNIEEPHAAYIHWDSATATMKMDGSLISLWFDNGEWHYSTNSTIDARKAELNNGHYKTYYDLFKEAWNKYNIDLDNLNPFLCYTFELVSKFNRVVIPYENTELYHLLTIDLRNFNEIEVDIGIPKPQFFKLSSKEDYINLVKSFEEDKEGIVVKDKFCNRVKIKTLKYFELHHKLNNGVITYKRALDLIIANDYEEFLSYFPEFKPFFDKVQKDYINISKILTDIEYKVLTWKMNNKDKSKKDFAMEINSKNLKYKQWYFLAYDNFMWSRYHQIKNNTSELIRYFNLKEDPDE